MWREWVERTALIVIIVASPFAAHGLTKSDKPISVRGFYVFLIAAVAYVLSIAALLLLMWS